MIRVLFVNHSTMIGGAETNLLNILRFSDQAGLLPVGVLLPANGPLRTEVHELGIKVGQISYHAFHWRNPSRYAHTMAQLLMWIRIVRPDVIHLNHQWLVSHVVQAGIITRTPVVCHVRNFLDEAFVNVERRWLNLAQAVVIVSKAAKQRALDLGLLKERIWLVHDGIDVHRFQRCPQPNTPQTTDRMIKREPVIGFAGRIVPEKGPEDLIRAMPLVLEAVPTAQLRFFGNDQHGGAFIQHLNLIASELEVSQHVQFLGFRRDIENVLKDFDVLAIPSRFSMPEGLPLTVLEGLAAGCIVVATPNSGVPEVIEDGKTGFLVSPDDPEALAAGIVEALTLPDSGKERIRLAGNALIKTEFTIQRQVARLVDVYTQLMR